MNVLLTGGTGFVGLAITEKLLDEGRSVVVFDSNTFPEGVSSFFKSKRGQFVYVKGDVLDKQKIMHAAKIHKIDLVIHAAAVTPNTERETHCGRSIVDVNCGGLVNVLEVAHEVRVDKFVYLSTGAVYGKGQWELAELFEDSTPADPETYYEITKFASERIALRYQQLTGLDVLIFRLGDVFGAWEHYSGARDVMSAPFQVTRLALRREKAFLPRAGLKNWVYSREMANSVFNGLIAPNLSHSIYHLSAPFRWSIEQWCELLMEKYSGFSYEVVHDELLVNVLFRPDHAPMNMDRMVKDIINDLRFNMEESFKDYTQWIDDYSTFSSN